MKVKATLLVLMLLYTAPLYAGPIKNFSFTDINGTTYNRSDLKGEPVVIIIGSHW